MAGISVKVNQGSLNKAIKAIQLFGSRKDEAIKRVVADNANAITSDAKKLCPVDTGLLRSSIKADISPNGFSATVGTDVFYSVYVEAGSSRKAPNGFLFPAFEQNRQSFLNNLKRILTS